MEFFAQQADVGTRLDTYIAQQASITRSAAVTLIEQGAVLVNGTVQGKNYKVRQSDVFSVQIPEPRTLNVSAEKILLDIVYEDDALLVVNKPQGMVVHPAAGNDTGTLVNALLYHCADSLSGINGVIRPGIVHRIDKDTSGLLIVAKTNESHLNLAEQIKQHSFLRIYNGIVYGHLKEPSGVINLPIGRDPRDRKRMAVTEKNSKNAVTEYQVLQSLRDSSLVEFRLQTGRTHQIRVHMAYRGHAIFGDPVYSPRNIDKKYLTGQLLHAKVIGFHHPTTGQWLEFDSPLPQRFVDFIAKHTD